MKKQLLSLGIIALVAGFSIQAYGQDHIARKVTGASGNVNLVVFKNDSKINSASASNIFKDVLSLSSNDQMKLTKSSKDFTGKFTTEKYQMYHNNIKVEGGVYNLHYKDGNLSSMSGEVFSTENVATNAAVSASSAFNTALQSVGAQKYMWEDAGYIANNDYKKPSGELVYLPVMQEDGKYKLVLAYKFDIYAAEPISRANVYIDATQGVVIFSDAIMKDFQLPKIIGVEAEKSHTNQIVFPTLVTGNAETRYSGVQNIETKLSNGKYILHDETRGGGVHTLNIKKSTYPSLAVEFQDDDNNWTAAEYDNANFDNVALDAHWGVEKTYDYFKSKFQRDSYDDNGSALLSYVHFDNKYDNAAWTGSEMIYGDGSGIYFTPLTAFDVTAHELGHGVCQTTAALLYSRESGALNEALSDIWGASVEHEYAPDKQTWLIGEDIALQSPKYLRSMSNPKSATNPPQPDTYHGQYWVPATVAEGCVTPNRDTNDYCGVHYNSGVINHWFYILSEGKSGTNDLGKSYNVTGIGIEKAAELVYKVETEYLTPSSDFMAMRDFTVQAAIEKYGENSAVAIATQDAFYAVGLGSKYLSTPDTTPPTAPLNLSATNTTGTSTQLSWEPSTDDNDLDKYIIYKDGTEIGTVSATITTFNVSGLTKNTTYSFTVKAEDAYDNISDESNVLELTTINTPDYCPNYGNVTQNEKIKRVKFVEINNPSTGTEGYEDFSYISTEVEKGKVYPIQITPDWSSTHRSEGYAVYIDWNNNGDFTDEGETAFTKDPSTSALISGNITIPDTNQKSVRMRVVMAYNAIRPSCGVFNFGQVEDYTLTIKGNLAVSDINSSATTLYPNPVKDVINIQNKVGGELTYKIYNAAGQIVANGISADKKISAQKLPAGNYIIQLTDKEGASTTSKFIKK